MSAGGRYIGRFAPSPTGPLHAGSLVAALASWLDARAAHGGRGGRWLVRIEDVDPPRCMPGADQRILAQLAACGLLPDEPPRYQSSRGARYQQALDQLLTAQLAYPCACTRRDIDAALAARGLQHERHVERPYPGTCRNGLNGRTPRAWRFHAEKYQSKMPLAHTSQAQEATHLIADCITGNGVAWVDRRLGPQQQDVARQVGDFVLRRADGLWAYQLAVVVDDADQGVTHIVRGEDLADNTPRQILLQSALGLAAPQYLHTPLVCGADGEKLSKQHGAPPIDDGRPLQALAAAAQVLGLPAPPAGSTHVADALALWVRAWARTYKPTIAPL
ncbi:tRNA glutamyl-Q(34) synthetase GluQRS [Diaphorobacter sp.]|uniref:tRNA glutamyl-Q(34) synthetase GluQRS n=1 Tax=Diaphorobacter sp. TaxID=1934310 RepID=UPI003D0EC49E